jgi:class 3 adenylate cyclase/DNA-binding CsgD family transcriptional regulator
MTRLDPLQGTVTVMFTDLEGSTRLISATGDSGARLVIDAAHRVVRHEVGRHGGREIKSVGDGLLVTFSSARAAVAGAIAVQRAIEEHALRHPDLAVRLRIGLNAGDIIATDDDVFGATVNAAARIVDHAVGGEIVAADVVRVLTGDAPEFAFEELGSHELRGFAAPLALHRVRWRSPGNATDLPTSSLVGRDAELARIAGALEAARAGKGSVIVLEGEGGIGKSRLADEAVSRATALGIRAFRGASHELERARPFGAAIEAFAIETGSPDPRRAEIAGMLREGANGPAELRFGVADAIADLVDELVVRTPGLLVLDDLHWADPSTLLVAAGIARRAPTLPLVVLIALRPLPQSPDVESLLDRLDRTGAIHLRLGPLSPDAVAQLARESLDATPGPALTQATAGTGGNPLYVIELISALRTDGAIEVTDGVGELRSRTLPEGLRVAILRRLSFLAKPTLDVLNVAATLGTSFAVGDVAAVTGRASSDMLASFDEAVRAGLLEARADRLAFRHDLIRDAIYEDVPVPVRRALHAQTGRVLAASGAPAVRVAEQFALATSGPDVAAAEWSRRAALEVGPAAPSSAVELLERALMFLPGDAGLHAEIDADLARFLTAAGRPADAEAAARRVLARAVPSDVELTARLAFQQALFASGKLVEGAAEARVSVSLDEAQRARLRAEGALPAFLSGDAEGAERQATAALEVAEPLGDAVTMARALEALSACYDVRGLVAEAIATARRSVAVAESAGSAEAFERDPRFALAMTLITAERLDEAANVLEDMRSARARWDGPLAHAFRALRHWRAGTWDECVAEAEASLAVADETGIRLGDVAAGSVLAGVCTHRGDLSRAAALLDEVTTRFGTGFQFGGQWFIEARAELLEASGRIDEAFDFVDTAWQAIAQSMAPSVPAAVFARLAIAAGAHDAAGRTYEAIKDIETPIPSWRAGVLHLRGMVTGDPDVVLTAVEAYRAGTTPLPLAQCCDDAAALLATAGRTDEARALREEAIAIYERLGAVRDIARAEAALRELGVRRGRRGRRQRPAIGWGSLTETELGVVRLVGDGLTNKVIGGRLFMSPRTVESHLAHVFAKLGLSSRVEVAAEAARRLPSP